MTAPLKNCDLTGLPGKITIPTNGKELLVCQRAKVGRFKLADFFVPLVGFHCRLELYERGLFGGPGILGEGKGHQP